MESHGVIARTINKPESTGSIILYNRFPSPRDVPARNIKKGDPTLEINYLEDMVKTPEGETVFYKPEIIEPIPGVLLAIYTAPLRFVKRCLAHKSDRYRLYNTNPLMVKIDQPNGARKLVPFNPWYFDVESFRDGVDPENGEVKYGKRISWHEDIDGKRFKSTLSTEKKN